jgi:hypothetical protein
MKTKLIPIIALLSVAWLYPACSKDEPCEKKTEIRYIAEKDRERVPYKGGETLTFLHVNTGDTVVFNAEPNWTQYFGYSSYGEGCIIEEKLEGRGIAFFNSKSNQPIVINQYIIEQGAAVFEVKFRDIEIKDYSIWHKGNKYSDSIVLHNKTYKDVLFFSNDDHTPSTTDFGCFYTYIDGIIKIYSKTGDTWELLSRN